MWNSGSELHEQVLLPSFFFSVTFVDLHNGLCQKKEGAADSITVNRSTWACMNAD